MTMISNGAVNTAQRAYGKTVNNLKYGAGLAVTGTALLAINKDSYISQKAGAAAKYVGGKIGNVLGKTKIGGNVANAATKVGNFFKPVTSKVGQLFSSIRNTSFVQKAAQKIAPYAAKIPFKPVATAAALLTAAVLIHKHGRNSGKIDQRYQDKQIFVRGFDLCG